MDLNMGRCTVKTQTFWCICIIIMIPINRIREKKLVPISVEKKGWGPGSMSVPITPCCEMDDVAHGLGCRHVLQLQSEGDDPFG